MSNAAPGVAAISVVIPLFNSEATIRRALDSARGQTASPSEIIVVDDGSTDAGPELARGYRDPRVRVVSQENRGVSAARNRGVAEASTDLVAFLDADDEWESDFLATVLALRAAWPACGLYATSYWIRSPGRRDRAVINGLPAAFKRGVLRDYFGLAAVSDPPVWSSAACVSKEALTSVGGFPEGVASGEDLLTWARLASAYDVAYETAPKAHFWQPVRMSDRPGRRPDQPDVVGAGLRQILDACPRERRRAVRRYLAVWHRMRAVLFLQLGDRTRARLELRIAFSFAASVRLLVLYVLALAPPAVSVGSYGALRQLRKALRR